MCLYNIPITSPKMINKLFGKNESIAVYKIFNKCGEKIISSFFYHPVSMDTNRFYISNRKNTEITKNEKKTNEINKGIHVYLKHPPKQNIGCQDFVVKCVGYKKDFVAYEAPLFAVFTKIQLPKSPKLKTVPITGEK